MRFAHLGLELAQLREQISALLDRKLDSRNSSKPPSSDPRQVVELQVRAVVLNRFTHLGTPVTRAVA